MERGLKQAEVDGRRKAEEVQAVKNKVVSSEGALYVILPYDYPAAATF